MTTDEKLALLQEWGRLYSDLDEQWQALSALTGATTDSPLGDAVWLLWDAYTRQVGERLGGAYEWLSWYELENGMGRVQHKAGPVGREKPICCIGDLLWAIDGEEE